LCDVVEELSRLYEQYSARLEEEFCLAQELVACLASFCSARREKLNKAFWFFDENMNYVRCVPATLLANMCFADKVRFVRKQFREEESFSMRLLCFILYDHVLNHGDTFVVCGRKDMLGVVEHLARSRAGVDKITCVADVLGENYANLIVKCQAYWRSWKSVQGDTTVFV